MAEVELDDLWLHTASDLSDYLMLELNGEVEDTSKQAVARRYANGRVRMIASAGTFARLDLRLEQVELPDVATLRSWVGTELLLREPRGRVMFGFYDSIRVEEVAAVGLAQVSLTFQEITGTIEA